MNILFLGDMVGATGREAVWARLPALIREYRLDFVVVNGENAAHGFGISESIFLKTIEAGADVVTTGNHVWERRETLRFCEQHDHFIRPANYPKGTPGKGSFLYEARNGARVLVANIMGRVFMNPALDDPFACAEDILGACPLGEQADVVMIDFHAEATSEKQCFGHFVDGRASLVVGTHTHIPTADCQILDGGTGYMSDAGMCGDYNSSLGMEKEEMINRFVSKISYNRMEIATGPATICGVGVQISDRTGLAEKIAPLRLGARLDETIPYFW